MVQLGTLNRPESPGTRECIGRENVCNGVYDRNTVFDTENAGGREYGITQKCAAGARRKPA